MGNKIKKIIYFIGVIGLFFFGAATAMGAATVSYGGVDYNIADNGAITGPGGASIGTFDGATGNISIPGGAPLNITDLTGAVVSSTLPSGGSISAVIDTHSYQYQVGMWTAGVDYLNAVAAEDSGAMISAVRAADAILTAESGGTQTQITIVDNPNGSVSYGCTNVQNTTITFPPIQPVTTVTPITPVTVVTPITSLPTTCTTCPPCADQRGATVPIDSATPAAPASSGVRIREVLPGE